MKRSEMLSLIENLYSRMLIINGLNAISPHDISHNILALIEQNGMLPPFTENNGEYATIRDADGYIWEPEDV